jgi:8-oxo-dGTP diphosphatase
MTTVYLVRHAHAGDRSGWKGSDLERPLSPKGRAQAVGLFELIGDTEIVRVESSPATRCVQTVEPLAEAHYLPVKERASLFEGSSVPGAVDDLLVLASRTKGKAAVMCSHGDMIPKMVRYLMQLGMETPDPAVSSKGSVWALRVKDGRVVSGRYHEPAAVDT